MDSQGILFAATGKRFYNEALIAIQTLKKVGSKIPTAIFTSSDLKDEAQNHFNHVYIIDNPQYSFIDKIQPIIDTPFERTLFLDTDIKLFENIDYIYEILKRFDLAFCYAPIRNSFQLNDVPNWFLEPNTGFILYRRNDIIKELMKNWLNYYKEQMQETNPPPHDQSSFRKALYQSNCTFYVLGQEFNFRSIFPAIISGGNTSIKVFHDRLPITVNKELYEISFNKDKNYLPKIFYPSKDHLNDRTFIYDNNELRKYKLDDNKIINNWTNFFKLKFKDIFG